MHKESNNLYKFGYYPGPQAPGRFHRWAHRVYGNLEQFAILKKYMWVYEFFWRVHLYLLNDAQSSPEYKCLSTVGFEVKYLK